MKGRCRSSRVALLVGALTVALSGVAAAQAPQARARLVITVMDTTQGVLPTALVTAVCQDGATSVAVRVYQLKDRKMFDGASYEDLLGNDRTLLAQDLQASMASVLNPGASARHPTRDGLSTGFPPPGVDGATARS